MTLHDLPVLNACLNASSAVCLVGGFQSIRAGNIPRHRGFMLTAFGLSIVFLVSYLTYHFQVGTTRFAGLGFARPAYFTLLSTHTVLAAIVPFLAIITLNQALRARFDRHRRIARWTLPIWLYVSVTGVLVYFMLYQWFPSR